MHKNGNPRIRRQPETGKSEIAACGRAAFSNVDFITVDVGRQLGGHIWQLLQEGEGLAIQANDLARLAGYSNTRTLRTAVDGLRAKGVPILATENSYFRPVPGPAGIAQIQSFLRRQDARAISNRRTTRLLRARLRELQKSEIDGQQTLFDGGMIGG